MRILGARLAPFAAGRAPFLAFLAFLASVAGLFGVACFTAGGTVTGGDPLFDTGAPTPVPCVLDSADAAADAEPLTGTTWTALYADFFGPTGKASCSLANKSCHGAKDQEGAKASLYVCGATIDSCYQGMTDPGAAIVESTGDPTGTTLYAILRKKCGSGGSMPLEPKTVAFSPHDLSRIAAWIAAGAPRN